MLYPKNKYFETNIYFKNGTKLLDSDNLLTDRNFIDNIKELYHDYSVKANIITLSLHPDTSKDSEMYNFLYLYIDADKYERPTFPDITLSHENCNELLNIIPGLEMILSINVSGEYIIHSMVKSIPAKSFSGILNTEFDMLCKGAISGKYIDSYHPSSINFTLYDYQLYTGGNDKNEI